VPSGRPYARRCENGGPSRQADRLRLAGVVRPWHHPSAFCAMDDPNQLLGLCRRVVSMARASGIASAHLGEREARAFRILRDCVDVDSCSSTARADAVEALGVISALVLGEMSERIATASGAKPVRESAPSDAEFDETLEVTAERGFASVRSLVLARVPPRVREAFLAAERAHPDHPPAAVAAVRRFLGARDVRDLLDALDACDEARRSARGSDHGTAARATRRVIAAALRVRARSLNHPLCQRVVVARVRCARPRAAHRTSRPRRLGAEAQAGAEEPGPEPPVRAGAQDVHLSFGRWP
jgi:hypothetical protein